MAWVGQGWLAEAEGFVACVGVCDVGDRGLGLGDD